MATQTTYTPRLKERYFGELRSQLQGELGLSNIMQVARPEKVVVNMGVGEASKDAQAARGGGERPHDHHRTEAFDPQSP